nr:uncharacterized protein LOC132597868 [Globicephala melas]
MQMRPRLIQEKHRPNHPTLSSAMDRRPKPSVLHTCDVDRATTPCTPQHLWPLGVGGRPPGKAGPGSIALAEGVLRAEPWRDAPSPPALLPKQGCRPLWIFLRSGLAVPLYSSQEALTPKSICGRPCLQRGRPRGLQGGHTPNPQHGVEPSTWPCHRAAGDLSASAEPLCASVLHHAFDHLPVCKVYGRFHKGIFLEVVLPPLGECIPSDTHVAELLTSLADRWLASCWRIHAGGQEAYPCAKQVPSESSPLSPAHQPMRTRGGDVTTSRFPALPGGWDQLGKRANIRFNIFL